MRFEATSSHLAGRYALKQALVVEGYRQVWRAFDTLQDRQVLIKGQLLPVGEDFSPSLRQEFEGLRLLSYPRLPSALDLGKTQQIPACVAPANEASGLTFHFIVQSFISGPSLWTLRGKLSAQEILLLMEQLLSLVAFLHDRSIVQLDLKPQHLLRTPHHWHLVDLGQARPDAPLAPVELHGTLPFLAPEVLAGSSASARADLYSVGALLYTAITGLAPSVEGETLAQASRWILTSPIPPLPTAQTPVLEALNQLCQRLMARDPLERPPSAEEALKSLPLTLHTPWRRCSPLPETRLFEREAPLAGLLGAFTSLPDGVGGGVWLDGDSLLGHSRLMQEACAHLQAKGFSACILHGRENRQGGLDSLHKQLRSLAHSEPEAARMRPQLSALAGESPEGQRQRAVANGLERLLAEGVAAAQSQGHAIPIFLDDLQLYDELSREILLQLFPLLPESGLFLVCRWPGKVCPPGLMRLELQPLTWEATLSLCDTMLGPCLLSPERLKILWRRSEGFPGDLRQQLLPIWQNQGDEQGSAGLLTARDTVAGNAQREKSRESVQEGPSTLLAHLSVLEQPFSWSLIEGLVSREMAGADGEAGSSTAEQPQSGQECRGHEAWISWLSSLVATGVLSNRATGEPQQGTYWFTHERYRLEVLSTLSPADRQHYHLAAAELLERRGGLDGQTSARYVAHHFIHAGLSLRAVPYLHRAIEDALQTLRLEEAAECLKLLLPLTASPAEHAALRLKLGQTLLALGRAREALPVMEQLLDRFPTAHASHLRAKAAVGHALAMLGQYEPARLALRAALLEAPDALWIPQEERAEWGLRLAWCCLSAYLPDEAREALASVENLELPSGSRHLVELRRYHLWLGLVLERPTPELVSMAQDALALVTSMQEPRLELSLLNLLVQVYQQAGMLDAARNEMEKGVALARRCHDLSREAVAVQNLGILLKEQSQEVEALKAFERAAYLQQRLGNLAAAARSLLAACELILEHGDPVRAGTAFQEASRVLELSGAVPAGTRLWQELLEARLLFAQGQTLGLDARLVTLEHSLRREGLRPLLLVCLGEQLSLALHEARWEDFWRLSGRLVEFPVDGVYQAAWRRIHRQALNAHAQRLSLLEGNGTTDFRPGVPMLAGVQGSTREPVVPVEAQSIQKQPAPAIPSKTAQSAFVPSAPSNDELPSDSDLPWLERLHQLLAVAEDEASLAAELAALAGSLFEGRGLVVLFGDTRPQLIRSFRMEGEPVESLSQSVLGRVRRTREAFVCPDTLLMEEVRQIRSLHQSVTRSFVCQPVLLRGECLGAIYVDHPRVGRVTGPRAVAVLERIASLTAELLVRISPSPVIGDNAMEFGLVGVSPAMQRLRQSIRTLCQSDVHHLVVLLQGETGTGKSAVAQIIHAHGARKKGPFINVNCAALADGIVEAELFGHSRGAFTGAEQERWGYFGEAHGGSLLLDEIGEMPMSQQSRLLTALQNWRYHRVNEPNREREMDFHLFCASNRPLKEAVTRGLFREDLLGRISSNVLWIPSLRERGVEDIRLLLRHEMGLLIQNRHPEHPVPELDLCFMRPAEHFLLEYDWPQNVRQLKNLFANEPIRQRIKTGGREKVRLDDVLAALNESGSPGKGGAKGVRGGERANEGMMMPGMSAASMFPARQMTFEQLRVWTNEAKAEYVRKVLAATDGNVSKAAELLDCARDVVYRYMRKSSPD